MNGQADKIPIAIIGGGLIGPRHALSVQQNPNATLCALVDPAPHGPQTAASLGCPHYPTVQSLLSSPHKPLAAIICTPNSTHVAISKELASAGVHILVEKPLSTDIESGRGLLEHLKGCPGVKMLVGHHRRFNSYVMATAAILSSTTPGERLGKVLAISGLWTLFKPPSYYAAPTAWRQGKDGGVVWINLIHEIDILQFLFGPISRVHAEATASTRGFEADEGAAIVFRFESGVVGTFVCCDASPSPFNFEAGTGENPTIPKVGRDIYRIFGTEASLSVPDMVRFSYDGQEGGKSWTSVIREEKMDVEAVVPFDAQVERLVNVVRGMEEPHCTGEEGLRALMVCDAVKRAMETGMPVDVERV